MARRPRPQKPHLTAWHPLYVTLLRSVLPRGAFSVRSEVLLSQQPQRIDTVVVRRRHLPPPPPAGQPLATARLFYEAAITIGELKGPKESLRGATWQRLLSYATQFAALEDIADPAQIQLMLVAPRLTEEFVNRVVAYGGQTVQVEEGLHRIEGCFHRGYVVEADVVDDPLLRVFSVKLMRGWDVLLASLPMAEQRAILVTLCSEVEQFRKKHMMKLRYLDYEELMMTLDESIRRFMKMLPAETRLDGLGTEERLKGLGAEERLKGLGTEERLKGLGAEERLKGLPPEELERMRQLLGVGQN